MNLENLKDLSKHGENMQTHKERLGGGIKLRTVLRGNSANHRTTALPLMHDCYLLTGQLLKLIKKYHLVTETLDTKLFPLDKTIIFKQNKTLTHFLCGRKKLL